MQWGSRTVKCALFLLEMGEENHKYKKCELTHFLTASRDIKTFISEAG